MGGKSWARTIICILVGMGFIIQLLVLLERDSELGHRQDEIAKVFSDTIAEVKIATFETASLAVNSAYDDLLSATVRISKKTPEGEVVIGVSGIVIDDREGIILTVAHGFQEVIHPDFGTIVRPDQPVGTEVELRFIDSNEPFIGILEKKDNDVDLALIRFCPNDVSGRGVAKFSLKNADPGELAIFLGAPGGHLGVTGIGIVSRPDPSYHNPYEGFWATDYLVSGTVLGGHSGSPVIDASGNLIGLCRSSMSGYACFIPADILLRFLKGDEECEN